VKKPNNLFQSAINHFGRQIALCTQFPRVYLRPQSKKNDVYTLIFA
jgi:hypothetical protein